MKGEHMENQEDQILLEVRDLTTCFEGRAGTVHAVNGVSFQVKKVKSSALSEKAAAVKVQPVAPLFRSFREAEVSPAVRSGTSEQSLPAERNAL